MPSLVGSEMCIRDRTTTTTTTILVFQGRPEYTPEALTHQARDPPPYGEEYNLANTSDVSLTQLSRPGT